MDEEASGRAIAEHAAPAASVSADDPAVGGIAAEKLKQLVDRIERLEEEKAGIAADIRDVYAEAKAVGFDTKILRQVVKLRKLGQEDRQEQEHLLELYQRALGMTF